jgi:Gnt-I system low-affinity gluconate transporter
LLFLIVRSKLQAFVALLLVALALGAAAGMPLEAVLESVSAGMGGTLGSIAVLVGLGAMFGRMLEVSGGAASLAKTLLERFGPERAQWSLGLIGFLVAIPVFFDVAFIILVPAIYGLTRRTGRSLVYYGLPLLAGLAATHAFVPPTPGPIAVAALLGADLGWVIVFGVSAGLPAMVVAGPLFARLAGRWVQAPVPDYMEAEPIRQKSDQPTAALPSFRLILSLTVVPLALIISGSLARALLDENHRLRAAVVFVGHPFVALLATTLLAFHLLGTRRGMSRTEVQALASRALEPAGLIILVTGAGGVLKQVLIDSGVGRLLAQAAGTSSLPPVLAAFLVAAVLRLIQGSATVAMLTAAGLVASLVQPSELSPPLLGLVAVAIAAGATTTSHVNDSGFWLVNRYFGLSVEDTLRTWTVATTLVALVGLAVTLGLSLMIG